MKILRFNENISTTKISICKKNVKFMNGVEYFNSNIYDYSLEKSGIYCVYNNGEITRMTSENFLDHFIPNFDPSIAYKQFNVLGDLSFANTKFGVNSMNTPFMKIEKKGGGENHLTLIPKGNMFIINVTSGTINKPSQNVGATWYDLNSRKGKDKHDVEDVYDTLISYGIATKADKEYNLSVAKYNV